MTQVLVWRMMPTALLSAVLYYYSLSLSLPLTPPPPPAPPRSCASFIPLLLSPGISPKKHQAVTHEQWSWSFSHVAVCFLMHPSISLLCLLPVKSELSVIASRPIWRWSMFGPGYKTRFYWWTKEINICFRAASDTCGQNSTSGCYTGFHVVTPPA